MPNNRQPANYQDIASAIKTKILISINEAQEDLADILSDQECSAQFIRNAVGGLKELDRAEKSLTAALAIAKMEVSD